MSAAPEILLVRDLTRPWSGRTVESFAACFRRLGCRVTVTTELKPVRRPYNLVAGWGWGSAQMRAARAIGGERFIHVDNAILGAGGWGTWFKVALGERWTPLAGGDFPPERLARAGVKVLPSRRPGKRVLLCGVSAKAVADWGEEVAEWERDAILRLRTAGAKVYYRPKPGRGGVSGLPQVARDPHAHQSLAAALADVDAVATHHSASAVEALAAGLPVFDAVGAARSLSAASLENLVGAEAPPFEARRRLLCELAWHQHTLAEIAAGDWLRAPAPLAGRLAVLLGTLAVAPGVDPVSTGETRTMRRVRRLEERTRFRAGAPT